MTTTNQAATQVHVSKDAPNEWEPFPLEAVEGDPDGRVHFLRQSGSGEGMLMAGMFTGQPSKFEYEFAGDETFHTIEGRVSIEVHGGETVELGPGDIVSFPKGAKSLWHIKEPMKKFFVISG